MSTIPENFTLIHMQLLLLHGHRTPISSHPPQTEPGLWRCDAPDISTGKLDAIPVIFPRRFRKILDPRLAEYPPSCTLGELTIHGINEMYTLGKLYRTYLIENLKFLPENLNPDDIFVRATQNDRTFKSAMSFLKGLYQPQTMDELLDITTGTSTYDILIPDRECSDIIEMQNKYLLSNEYKNAISDIQQRFEDIKDYLNVTTWDIESVDRVCDWITTMSCNNQSMHEMIRDSHVKACRNTRAKFFFDQYMLDNATYAVPFATGMREMMDSLNNFISLAGKQKFVVMVGEESTMAAMLSLLHVKLTELPEYASHLEMQLLESKTDRRQYIRFVMNGEPLKLKEFDGAELVRMDHWSSVITPLIDSICKAPSGVDL